MVLNCIILGNDPEGFGELETFLSAIPYVYFAGRYQTMKEARIWLDAQVIDVLLVGCYDDPLPPPPGQQDVLPVMVMTYSDPPGSFDYLPVELLQLPLTQTALTEVFTKIYNLIDMEGIARPSKYAAEYFVLKTAHRLEKVFYKDLQYIEVMDDHITLHLEDQKLVTTETLDWIISQLPANAFMRVHRWFVISLRHITELNHDHVMIGAARISLTSSIRNELEKRYKLPM
ncbi:MAG: LytTR family transcriptional regulator DNA-binding domain-containing protein [Chitinophaga sp.]|uniref:LytR/AlgR family response regulator transcription factor n=1 Tax=Chitinophaga sp. TaxID=1869181 RepID=UPI001B052DC8|nr:LytTR family DNA-binding domain-containing protein [Chitinophaga sp.]MBO9728065.1 LytTR family transcriptional regulator DNA-binding domain-containing protein [Chitinophaga sp.]